MTNQIGKYAVTYDKGHTVLHDGNFEYWLSKEEIDYYTKLYVEHNGKMDIRMFDHFVTQLYIQMRQSTYWIVRGKILSRSSITKSEIKDIIKQTEQNLASKSKYYYLGTENDRRHESFLRTICGMRDLKTRITDL